MARAQQRPADDAQRFGRNTLAFSRVVNLSDAVFAIALTLLVLTLDVPTAEPQRLAAALVDQLPQFVAFALSFALVANLWWQHHRLLDLLESIEPGVIGVNLVLLAFVALVPYPTSLLGVAPGTSTAVILFVAVFVVLTLLHLALLARAGSRGLVRDEVPRLAYLGLLAGYGVGALVLLVAILIAIWSPTLALVIVGISIVLGPIGARRTDRYMHLATSTIAEDRGRRRTTGRRDEVPNRRTPKG
jgi:uncharacterized membrane protein